MTTKSSDATTPLADTGSDPREQAACGAGVVFAAEEHLRVQQEIERRAGELWCAGGCRPNTALDDWLLAEGEVIEQFIRAYPGRYGCGQVSNPGATVRVARKKRRILRRAQLLAARDRRSLPV